MQQVSRKWTTIVGAALLALVASVIGAPSSQAAGLLIADGGFGGVLEIEEHEVDVVINNGIAVTQVTQVFRNTENRQVEALYTFPVPKGASVANFSMWINGKEMVGEVIEKQRAREIYNSYKQQRRDPGLLEQNDYKTFEMRIFPIGPRAEQRVQISYYQELDFDSAWATYVYPLSTTTQEATGSRTQGRLALNMQIASEVPITELESPSHGDEFALAQHTPHHAQASFEAQGGDLNRDFVLAYRVSRPVSGLDVIASKPPREDGYSLLTLTAGEELEQVQSGMDYLFILDVSGSMNNDGKLGLSRDSLSAFIDALGAEDRFEVLTFNVEATALFSDLRQPDADTREQAATFLADQRAKGGTFLEPAIRSAYSYDDPDRQLNVVILSDGMTEQGERQTLIRLIGQRPAATRVFAIGVGNDVNRPLLRQLTDEAGGLAAFLSRGDNFERQAQAFRRKLLRPAVSNLRLEAEGGALFDIEPRRLPDLYHGMPIRIYARYLNPGPVTLNLTGNIGGERFERSIEITIPPDADNSEVERMWAWHRVQRLQQDADRDGGREKVIDEIVRLGEGFSIVTEYTSFLVLENDAEYRRWRIERRNATRIERDRAKQERVRGELEALRRKASADVGPVSRRSKLAPATPAVNRPTAPTVGPANSSQPAPSRGRNIDFGGGGALDPISVTLMLGFGGASYAALRRRRKGRRGQRRD